MCFCQQLHVVEAKYSNAMRLGNREAAEAHEVRGALGRGEGSGGAKDALRTKYRVREKSFAAEISEW